jgi:hypothetical protein
VEIEKVKVGTGTEIATEDDTNLSSPLPFDFAIINRSSDRVGDRAFSANYVSMIETDDPNASFSFSEGTELEFVIMVIAVSCVKLLSAHNSTQHTSRKHKV